MMDPRNQISAGNKSSIKKGDRVVLLMQDNVRHYGLYEKTDYVQNSITIIENNFIKVYLLENVISLRHDMTHPSIRNTHERISVHEYYLEIAEAASKRSTCDRAQVGCVIVNDNHILDTGYNGSLPGYEHCDKQTCYFEGHCIRTTHAEINALKRAIETSGDAMVDGAILYSTLRPCYSCLTTLAAFGIKEIYFRDIYEDPKAEKYAKIVGLKLTQIKKIVKEI